MRLYAIGGRCAVTLSRQFAECSDLAEKGRMLVPSARSKQLLADFFFEIMPYYV
jgi:hypothetical protein